jgi:cytoskeletal protein RodZ
MKATTREQLGQLIREARLAKGLTVREAAAKLDMDWSYYRKIEAGQYALGKYARPIAKLLGLNGDELEARAVKNLPNFAPYLRAKYQLDDEAIAELEAHFTEVSKGRKPRGRS